MKVKVGEKTIIGSSVEITEELRRKAYDQKDTVGEYLDWLQDHLRRFFKPGIEFGPGSEEERALAAINALADLGSLKIEEE